MTAAIVGLIAWRPPALSNRPVWVSAALWIVFIIYWNAGGLFVQTASLLLGVWARRHLGRNWSGAITIAVDHQLIRSGPYRVVRHPIYSAMLGVVIIAAAYWRKIRLEEENLRAEFGPAYDEYRRHSWAVVPGVF